MLKKFIEWFICFGLSFLVADVFGWTDQGRAFLYIYLGVDVALIAIFVIILLIAGIAFREKLLALRGSFLSIIITIIVLAVILFATWGATKLFGVDFFVTFQIMTFGACLNGSSNSKSKSKSED